MLASEKYKQILPSFGFHTVGLFSFQTVSEIRTVLEWDTAELAEIQTSSDFRHSLYTHGTHTVFLEQKKLNLSQIF